MHYGDRLIPADCVSAGHGLVVIKAETFFVLDAFSCHVLLIVLQGAVALLA